MNGMWIHFQMIFVGTELGRHTHRRLSPHLFLSCVRVTVEFLFTQLNSCKFNGLNHFDDLGQPMLRKCSEIFVFFEENLKENRFSSK